MHEPDIEPASIDLRPEFTEIALMLALKLSERLETGLDNDLAIVSVLSLALQRGIKLGAHTTATVVSACYTVEGKRLVVPIDFLRYNDEVDPWIEVYGE